jgi:hypothetical protein
VEIHSSFLGMRQISTLAKLPMKSPKTGFMILYSSQSKVLFPPFLSDEAIGVRLIPDNYTGHLREMQMPCIDLFTLFCLHPVLRDLQVINGPWRCQTAR